ncbi:MAG: PAS domain-containing protein [Candidatus Magasanikbacteria bacterium]|jgi:PAS domain S-box-containing protein|nr:PAS domain-containing protein [Candidatus Magasanikbacteria bacterium]MBT4315089.1 PAS domain-containing protein [Candidatus Magasanikbacteria bacterium]MBT4546999.1 PAS domain-containing protein [Candidatus Magasanikbacteria bacterium]MBT6818769.1 PAS domain-containing protein [Candidatus Magasanikbacteria bacterium]
MPVKHKKNKKFNKMPIKTKVDLVNANNSDERFKNAVYLSGSMAYQYDIFSKKLFLFGPTKKVIGYSEKESAKINASAWKKMVHPDDRKRVYDLLYKTIKTGKKYEAEYRIKHKKGSYLYVRDHGAYTFDKKGKVINLFGSVVNIDSSVKNKHELEELKDKYQILSDNIFDGVFIHQDGIFLEVNETLAKMLGCKTKEIIGKKLVVL